MKRGTQSNKKLKTFNLDQTLYNQFSNHCKTNGISMSKKIENFIKQELEKLTSPIKQETKHHPFQKYC